MTNFNLLFQGTAISPEESLEVLKHLSGLTYKLGSISQECLDVILATCRLVKGSLDKDSVTVDRTKYMKAMYHIINTFITAAKVNVKLVISKCEITGFIQNLMIAFIQ